MKKRFNKGYSVETAEEYIDVNEEFVCVSKGDLINKYDNEKKKRKYDNAQINFKIAILSLL